MWFKGYKEKEKKEDTIWNMWFIRIQGEGKEDKNVWFIWIQGEGGYTHVVLDGYRIKEREYKCVVKNDTCPKH